MSALYIKEDRLSVRPEAVQNRNNILQSSLDLLGLDRRRTKGLKSFGANTIEDLTYMAPRDLEICYGFSKKGVKHLAETLRSYGLELSAFRYMQKPKEEELREFMRSLLPTELQEDFTQPGLYPTVYRRCMELMVILHYQNPKEYLQEKGFTPPIR